MKTVEEHLSPGDAAARLGVSRTTVWREIKRYRLSQGVQGIGPVVMVGSSPRLAASAINKYLESRKV